MLVMSTSRCRPAAAHEQQQLRLLRERWLGLLRRRWLGLLRQRRLCSRRHRSLSPSFAVRSRLACCNYPSFAYGTRQCGSARCKTCAMVQDIQEIQLADQPRRREVIKGKFTCALTNVVYLLTCTACQTAYVGEAGCTLRERMNGHQSAIKNGKDTPVADHFKEEHSVRVSVLTSTPEEVVQRR